MRSRRAFTPLLLLALAASLSAQQPTTHVEVPSVTYEGGSSVRLLPPRDRKSSGSTLVETLILDPDVTELVFEVDGEVRARRKRPPWRTKIKLDHPPREQLVRVEARDILGRLLGHDEIVFNRTAKPLRVAIRSLETIDDALQVDVDVSTPSEVELESVDVYLNERQVESLSRQDFEPGPARVRLPGEPSTETDFVRVVARLGDGRTIEDTRLVSDAVFQEEIEVRLVQLQVLVTDRQGRPLRGFEKDHFSIRDRGGERQPAGLFEADDVSLLLGYVLDSSGSMRPIWEETLAASKLFLDATLTDRDRGFLVDFDWRIRLLQESTSDKAALESALLEVEPEGGTALYDSVIYSLLQFDRQQGRRGLVVLTDGFDADSQSDPKRAVDFARRLGVPVYIVVLDSPGQIGGSLPPAGQGRPGAPLLPSPNPMAELAELRLLTDPTGGRFLRVGNLSQMRQALAQINAEMRNQYVLTYYTDTPPEPGDPPDVRVDVEGAKKLDVRVVLGADQIY